jgi:tetratricopeptide (TPR) repeat protein
MGFSAIRLASAALCSVLASPLSFSIPVGNTPQNALGRVVFPTSCAAGVQSVLTTGVALLHSFQYLEAKKTFADAAQRDQRCAMAFWGQAMSLYHQLWDFPQSESLKEGLSYLQMANRAGVLTERERGYLAAAAAFYQDNAKLSHLDRTRAYSSALATLHQKFPDDIEAAAFYALSFVALAEEDEKNTAELRKQAINLLEPLLASHPDNPGIAHYLIHATDTPQFASQGLDAARRYAKIAPDSSHAIHMPSHIFVRLGLWRESIDSNIRARDSAAHAAEMHMAESHYQTHAMNFLNYSYLQSGQEAKARQVIADLQNVVGAQDESKTEDTADLLARTALELHRWKEAAALPIPKIRLTSQESTYRARVIGKARAGDAAGARADFEKLKEIWDAQKKTQQDEGYTVSTEEHASPAEAWLLFAEGKHHEAVKQLRATADHQDAKGVDSLSIPAREMLADMLMELNRPAEALGEFKTALKNSPNRFDSLYGAAEAAQAAGDLAAAREFSAKLTQVCGSAADRPELAEVRSNVTAEPSR